MYIRMTGGRDRGEVRDFNFEDAQALITKGHAVAVNFNEADPLAKKLDFEIRDEQSQIAPPIRVAVPQRSNDAPSVVADKHVLSASKRVFKRNP